MSFSYTHAGRVKKKQTKVLKRTDSPVWEEEVKFTVRDPESDMLKVTVFVLPLHDSRPRG